MGLLWVLLYADDLILMAESKKTARVDCGMGIWNESKMFENKYQKMKVLFSCTGTDRVKEKTTYTVLQHNRCHYL